MFGVTDLGLFIVSGLALNMIPGPDSLYVIGRSAGQGFRAGSVAALGIGSGTLIHIFAAAFGLSAILATSAMAFTIIKIIGCVYLLYMGIVMLLSKKNTLNRERQSKVEASLSSIFYQGFLTNVLNPKVALFFLAFVPQFIAIDAPNKALSFLFLGLVFNLNGMIWCHFLAWSSSSIGRRVRQNTRMTLFLTKCTGGLFLYFGIRLAFAKQS